MQLTLNSAVRQVGRSRYKDISDNPVQLIHTQQRSNQHEDDLEREAYQAGRFTALLKRQQS